MPAPGRRGSGKVARFILAATATISYSRRIDNWRIGRPPAMDATNRIQELPGMPALLRIAFALVCWFMLAVAAPAQSYPDRIVRIVNPFPPGGSVDVLTRILAQKLSENFGQQFIIETRTGGGGNVGAEMVGKSDPDGYTLLFTAPGPLVVNQTLYGKLPFDPAKDFAP